MMNYLTRLIHPTQKAVRLISIVAKIGNDMNNDLKEELILMAETDQRVLHELAKAGILGTVEYHPSMREVHEGNTDRLKQIIEKHGWPDIDLVGAEGAEAAWLIVQHSVSDLAFMRSCVPLLEKRVHTKKIEGWQLAFLLDRVLTMSGKPQLYGTQFENDEKGWPVPYPISEANTVNERRAKLGLNSIEERTEEMHQQELLLRKKQKMADNAK